MKLNKWLLAAIVPLILIGGLLFAVITSDDDDDSGSGPATELVGGGQALSPEVLKLKNMVEKYCKQFGIPEDVMTILAIIQVESGGKGGDVMQSSESLGQSPGSLSTEASVRQGVKYFSEIATNAKSHNIAIEAAIQAYNYGGGFLDYVIKHGSKYTFDVGSDFAKEKAGGRRVTYTNPIAPEKWRYAYGNMFYAKLVSQYLGKVSGNFTFTDKTVKEVMA